MSIFGKNFRKSLSLVMVFAVIAVSVSLTSNMMTAKANGVPLKVYNPYEQIAKAVSTPYNVMKPVNFSGMDFKVRGTNGDYPLLTDYDYAYSDATGKDFYVWRQDIPASDNDWKLVAWGSHNNALGAKVSAAPYRVSVDFVAPESGEYLLVPKPINYSGANGKSVFLDIRGSCSCDFMFEVNSGGNNLYTTTLNSTKRTDDLDNDIGLTLKKGQKITFDYKTDANWEREDTYLFANFDVYLMSCMENAPVKYYNLYEQIEGAAGNFQGDNGYLNSSKMNFGITGTLWDSAWHNYDKVNVSGGKYKGASSADGSTDGYAYLWANSDFSNATGTCLNDPTCFVNVTFTAPVAGEYRIEPKGIAAEDNHSVYIHKYNSGAASVSDKTLKITANGAEKFSITRNSANPTGDLPDNISAVLREGQTIVFTFSSGEDSMSGCMFVNFDINLMRVLDDAQITSYNPYSQLNSVTGLVNTGQYGEYDFTDFSALDFVFRGTAVKGKLYDYINVCAYNEGYGKDYDMRNHSAPGSTSLESYIRAHGSYSGAIGASLTDSNCYNEVVFVAPSDGEYLIEPLPIVQEGYNSICVYKHPYNDVVSDRTFEIISRGKELFSITLNSANPTGNIPNDIHVALRAGETITFAYSTAAADERYNSMYANYSVFKVASSAAPAEGIAFPEAVYAVPFGGILNIGAAVEPFTAFNDISYDVYDDVILAIDAAGNITAGNEAGYTDITVTTDDGALTDVTRVYVYNPADASSVYDISGMYNEAKTHQPYNSFTANTLGTTQPWKAGYKDSLVAEYTDYDYVYTDGGNENFITRYNTSNDDYCIYAHAENSVPVMRFQLQGQGDGTPYYNALMFTAPEDGIYNLGYSDYIQDNPDFSSVFAKKGYVTLHSATKGKVTGSVKIAFNIYLEDRLIYSDEFSEDRLMIPFPTLDCLEMQAGDSLTIELVTPIGSGFYVYISPKMVKVWDDEITRPVREVRLSENTETGFINDMFTLNAKVFPQAANQTVTFESDVDSVATVDAASGLVTAVGSGTATITVTAGTETDTCTVTVNSRAELLESIKTDLLKGVPAMNLSDFYDGGEVSIVELLELKQYLLQNPE